jgi:hypothetical protein
VALTSRVTEDDWSVSADEILSLEVDYVHVDISTSNASNHHSALGAYLLPRKQPLSKHDCERMKERRDRRDQAKNPNPSSPLVLGDL